MTMTGGLMTFDVFSVRAAVMAAAFAFCAVPAHARPTLSEVNSHVYMIATGPGVTGVETAIGQSPVDLVILAGGEPRPAINRTLVDPNNSKIIVNYVDVTETARFMNPQFWANGKPSIAGSEHPAFPGLYSVQYWDPAWKPELFRQIDLVIAGGYDGVFLDLPFGDWEPGNHRGNPVRATSGADLVNLIKDIRAYVDGKNLGRPFYLIANEPAMLAAEFPSALSVVRDSLPYIDGVFFEMAVSSVLANDGTKSERSSNGEKNMSTYRTVFAPLVQGKPVFGNDYTTDPILARESADFYASLGWAPSVTNALQNADILRTGPFTFMSTTARPAVTGKAGFVNILAGGRVDDASLTGADKGDIIIGGAKRSVISAGAGDDTIYAHPVNVSRKNILAFQVDGGARNTPAPKLTVKINGTVVHDAAITGDSDKGTRQSVEIDTSAHEPVRQIEFSGAGIRFVDQSTFSNIFVRSVQYQGQSLSFTGAARTGNAATVDAGATAFLNSEGAGITLSGAAVAVAAPVFGDTRASIDGGAGTDTVHYRANLSNYTLTENADGSLTVSSRSTSEGPDTLRNVEFLQFTDQKIAAKTLVAGITVTPEQGATYSLFRFENTGTSSGAVTMVFRDGATGQQVGQWTSPSIAPNSVLQQDLRFIELAFAARPATYAISIAPAMTGNFQHVYWRPNDGTLANLTTCSAGVTANRTTLNSVHTSLVTSGYPSLVSVSNTGSATQRATLAIFDARDGTRLGAYTTAPIPAGAQIQLSVPTIEVAASLKPERTELYHYNIKVEGAFEGYLQHIVINQKSGALTDMTPSCDLSGISVAAATTLRVDSVKSSTHPSLRSLLRFHNTGANAGTVTVTARDAATGATLGSWTSDSIPPNAENQVELRVMEQSFAPAQKPDGYSVSVTSGISGYLQHVSWQPSEGTLTNITTCAGGVTVPGLSLSAVHTSIIGPGYPSTMILTNTGDVPTRATLDVYDARDGTKVGTFVTPEIPAKAQLRQKIPEMEAAMGFTPTGWLSHYVVNARPGFTGFLQHVVNNESVGMVTDMTTACVLAKAQ